MVGRNFGCHGSQLFGISNHSNTFFRRDMAVMVMGSCCFRKPELEKLLLHSRSLAIQVLPLLPACITPPKSKNHLLYGQPRPSHFRRLASLPNTLCQQSEPRHRHLLRQMPPRLSFQLQRFAAQVFGDRGVL